MYSHLINLWRHGLLIKQLLTEFRVVLHKLLAKLDLLLERPTLCHIIAIILEPLALPIIRLLDVKQGIVM